MIDTLTGKTAQHLSLFEEPNAFVHRDIVQPLTELFAAARKEGFDLHILSSFRSFERQCTIWNEKVAGKRPVHDDKENVVDLSTKTPLEVIHLILRWSALPGASRHHWGTDFDFYDVSRMPTGYKIKLVTEEYTSTGPFGPASEWLNENLEQFGFFRPYTKIIGGVAPEPWHISHKPIADELLQKFTLNVFKEHLNNSDFALIETVRAHADDIYQKYILV